MGDAKALDAMVHDGLTNPFSGKQMFDEATEIGDELEITRADLDRWALRSHERALAAIDEGRMADEIVTVTVKGGRATPTSRSTRARAAARRSRRSPSCPASSARRARTPPATRRASTTAAARSSSLRRVGRRERQGGARRDRRARAERQRLRLPRHDTGEAAKKALDKAGPAAGRHRRVGDQRGVRLRRR